MKKLFIFVIKLYQYTLGPFTQGHCRFYPTCSCYAIDAFERHGIFKGLWLVFKRLLKCSAFHPGGHDPCP